MLSKVTKVVVVGVGTDLITCFCEAVFYNFGVGERAGRLKLSKVLDKCSFWEQKLYSLGDVFQIVPINAPFSIITEVSIGRQIFKT